ncbi:MAG: hypothetical protein AAGD88_10435 [Bacteroidota bacterium]
MTSRFVLFCCLLFAVACIAQVPIRSSSKETPPPLSSLSQYRIDYPMGTNGETFFNGALDFRISERLRAGLQNFYAKFGTMEQINTATIVRYHVTDKVNVFAGTESQYGTNLITGEHELLRVNLNVGVGYEVDEDVILEMGYHPQISAPKKDLQGRSLPKQNTLSLRARF